MDVCEFRLYVTDLHVIDPTFSSGIQEVKVKYWVEPAQIKDAEKGDLLFYAYTLRTGQPGRARSTRPSST
jgi:hypothetical protein